ncbi:HAD family hydrolase [Kitasatospora aureofaciens]|uniref:HAD family hydrolase n=1 Tax=Kitasatospora aureofaciens TaxID=1894 RepID=UPI000690DC64|nr:HAD family hydrolase [Kitasatospora aureofaciens]
MSTQRRHAVWDWNGTLLDDNEARLVAVNESLAAIGQAPISLHQYRDTYCVPVPHFYAKLLGRPLTITEWRTADDTYQAVYHEHLPQSGRLMPGARQALLSWIARGGTQSLLSLHSHTRLLAELSQHGIGTLLRAAEGRRGPTGGTKAAAMRRHVQALGIPRQHVVAIGDSADDALAAEEAGIAVVLYTGGSHSETALAATGAPVAHTLAEAVDMALGTPAKTRPTAQAGAAA